MVVGISAGHTILKNGLCTSASGIHNEYKVARDIKNKVIEYLKLNGHSVVDCTTKDYIVNTATEDLKNKVAIANKQHLDLYVDIHLNASNGEGNGTETYYFSNNKNGEKFASNIHKKLVGLGFKDRKIKTSNFYVLKNTNATAVLVEAYFCDNYNDCKKSNVDEIAKAIASGIIGEDIKTSVNKDKKLFRVLIDDKHIGSFANIDNIVNTIKSNISNCTKIEIVGVQLND